MNQALASRLRVASASGSPGAHALMSWTTNFLPSSLISFAPNPAFTASKATSNAPDWSPLAKRANASARTASKFFGSASCTASRAPTSVDTPNILMSLTNPIHASAHANSRGSANPLTNPLPASTSRLAPSSSGASPRIANIALAASARHFNSGPIFSFAFITSLNVFAMRSLVVASAANVAANVAATASSRVAAASPSSSPTSSSSPVAPSSSSKSRINPSTNFTTSLSPIAPLN
mmetsp:Transcript_1437/g.5817  ORF Transcript_1437/g.5817 Transcript_1437/m.5817 type:complete len:236 (-) Transcript_1437:399-1106(-)